MQIQLKEVYYLMKKILFFAINNKISLDEIFLLNNNQTVTEIKKKKYN